MADVVVTDADREAADRMLREADLVTLDRYEQSVAEAFARRAAQARKQALEEAAEAYRAEAETWNELGPRKSAAVRRGVKVIRAIGDKP